MATNNHIPHLCFMSLIFTLISVLTITRSMASITIDLIHRDSSRSPLFSTSTSSHVDKLNAELKRSISRARYLTRPSDADTIAVPIGGVYIIELGIGTPPTPFFGIVDTGSDLTWTQCEPCVDCFRQTMFPVFDPAKSTSYSSQPCDSNECKALPTGECTNNNTCAYTYNYDDNSYSEGDLAKETLTFGPEFSYPTPNFVFGCGHQNKGEFDSPSTGLVGLGRGSLSLLSQFGGKFSYCLTYYTGKFDESVSSKITFGESALLSGDDVFSSPMLSGANPSLYYLNLEGVSIGDKTVAFNNKHDQYARLDTNSDEGNTIIDSGTTLTFLPEGLLEGIMSELRRQIDAKTASPPSAYATKLCYADLEDVKVPNITFHFTGVNLGLPKKNTFMEIPGGFECLSMMPMDSEGAIFGNMAQQNFIVGYDNDAQKVSFKATDCSKYA